MRRLLFALVVITLTLSAFSQNLSVWMEKSSVLIGSKLALKVELKDQAGRLVPFTLKAKLDLGGFDKPDVLTKGIRVNGSFELNYLAPKRPGTAKITVIAEVSAREVYTKNVEVQVVERDESEFTEQVSATVESFRGSVALRKKDKQVWEGLKRDSKIQEGDEVLTLEQSYVVLAFPDGSKTRVTENTQVLFERLRRAKDGRLLVSLVIKKGGTYNVVQKMMAGSSFEVKAGSVTAGVRGTTFGVEYYDEKPRVKVWDGEVFAFYDETFVVPVLKGQDLVFREIAKLFESIDDLINALSFETLVEPFPEVEKLFEELEKTIKGTTDGGQVQPGAVAPFGVEPIQPTSQPPRAFVPPLGVETVRRSGTNYIVYSISPEFSIGPVTIGVGLTAYASEVGGPLYYGIPSDSTPSTNIVNILTLNSLALDLGNFYARYGSTPPVTLGLGFSVRDYIKPYTKSFDAKLRFGTFELYAHLPYELTKLWPFEFAQSDSIFAGELSLKGSILGMDLGLAALYDASVNNVQTTGDGTPINLSLSTFVRYPILGNVYMGVEGAAQFLSDFSKTGFGLFAGLSGRLALFDVIAGAFAALNGFQPFHFGRMYNFNKERGELGTLKDGSSSVGYLAGFSFFTDLAAGRLYLHGDLRGSNTLMGELRASIPQVGAIAGLYLYGYYIDQTPLAEGRVFDSDTVSFLRITYPIMERNLVVGILYQWDAVLGNWMQSIYIGAESSW